MTNSQIGEEIIYINGKAILIKSSQKWFWSDEWQAGEKEVDKYIQDGNVQSFDTMDEFLKFLK